MTSNSNSSGSTKPRLLVQMREEIRKRHYTRGTEKIYLSWAKQYIRFHKLKHPAKLGAEAIEQFLTYLAIERRVASSTQNQALNSLTFLYKRAFGRAPLPFALDKKYQQLDQSFGIVKHAGARNLRHSCATHMLLNGNDIRTVQKLLGHKSLKTTMIYLRIAESYRGVSSPTNYLAIPNIGFQAIKDPYKNPAPTIEKSFIQRIRRLLANIIAPP